MSRVLRFDSGKIGALERTPTGGLFARGNIARTGIQVYRDADGTEVREYRPPDEVFATDTLASLDAAVVTIGHPQDLLTPQNVRQVMQGFMTGGTEREDTDDGVSWIVGRMALVTPEIMAGVDSGDLAELSAGYSLRIDATPGITPRGERYDRVQRDIRFNHVGFGPAGWARAGRDATLRLDGNENFPGDGRPEKESNKMAYRIDGKTVEDSDVQRAVVDLEAARDAAVIRADAADAKQGELASELAAANALAAELQASFDGRDAEISAEVAFRAEAGDRKSVV